MATLIVCLRLPHPDLKMAKRPAPRKRSDLAPSAEHDIEMERRRQEAERRRRVEREQAFDDALEQPSTSQPSNPSVIHGSVNYPCRGKKWKIVKIGNKTTKIMRYIEWGGVVVWEEQTEGWTPDIQDLVPPDVPLHPESITPEDDFYFLHDNVEARLQKEAAGDKRIFCPRAGCPHSLHRFRPKPKAAMPPERPFNFVCNLNRHWRFSCTGIDKNDVGPLHSCTKAFKNFKPPEDIKPCPGPAVGHFRRELVVGGYPTRITKYRNHECVKDRPAYNKGKLESVKKPPLGWPTQENYIKKCHDRKKVPKLSEENEREVEGDQLLEQSTTSNNRLKLLENISPSKFFSVDEIPLDPPSPGNDPTNTEDFKSPSGTDDDDENDEDHPIPPIEEEPILNSTSFMERIGLQAVALPIDNLPDNPLLPESNE